MANQPPRADSGTEEEFNRAYSRWRTDADSVAVMMYFSDVSMPPSKIELQLLAAVRGFRSRIEDRGIYCEFGNLKEFGKLVYDHLSSHMHRWSKHAKGKTPARLMHRVSVPQRVVLHRERVPFMYGQRADFFKSQLSQRCKRFELTVDVPREPYWRAGFALAPNDNLEDGRTDVTITRDFLFHIGRGSSTVPTEYTELHYQAYSKDQPITYTTPFHAPPGPVELEASISANRRQIAVQLGDARFEGKVDLAGDHFLYILAWADQFGPFQVPVELTLF